MLPANLRGRRSDQTRKGRDELPRLGQILVMPGFFVLGEPNLHGGGTHEVHGGARDDLYGCYIGNVARELTHSARVGGGGLGSSGGFGSRGGSGSVRHALKSKVRENVSYVENYSQNSCAVGRPCYH